MTEIMTGYLGSSDVQFVEITMNASGQGVVSGVRLNAFDAQGNFLATVLTVDGNVAGGANRPWIMGTPAFELASGIQADFEFANGALPADGGMVCWGKPGSNPTPVTCPASGSPYVDCIAYGTYAGPTNACIGTPHPNAPNGHSLQRVSDTNDNATDFVCSDSPSPKNNANQTGSLLGATPCPGATTTTVPPTTTTTLPVGPACGDANGDGNVTASDALVALLTAVGLENCPITVCDVDANGTVAAADALRILARAVGQDVDLGCPAS
jgi:hypothetical protein